VSFGGIDSLAGGDDVNHRGAIVNERATGRGLELIRALNPHAVQPDRSRDVGEVWVVQIGRV
jgi:hypothetical protein